MYNGSNDNNSNSCGNGNDGIIDIYKNNGTNDGNDDDTKKFSDANWKMKKNISHIVKDMLKKKSLCKGMNKYCK